MSAMALSVGYYPATPATENCPLKLHPLMHVVAAMMLAPWRSPRTWPSRQEMADATMASRGEPCSCGFLDGTLAGGRIDHRAVTRRQFNERRDTEALFVRRVHRPEARSNPSESLTLRSLSLLNLFFQLRQAGLRSVKG